MIAHPLLQSRRMRRVAKTLLEMRAITKEFPGVKALDNVNITVNEGEIHAIVGENGAENPL